MDEERLRALLTDLKNDAISLDQAIASLRHLPYETVGDFARLDHHRSIRTGLPEVIFAQNKTNDQVVKIFKKLLEKSDRVMATRVSSEMYESIRNQLPGTIYHPAARILYSDKNDDQVKDRGILVITGGTADIPVAEEAVITATLMGNQVDRIYDAGVAGLHRLLDLLPTIQEARVIIAVAGMEGALPSVVAGLVAAPVIAVPTSVGYGANFQGLAALLTMLNSCANGVAVVNIDNGFGAGYLASIINRLVKKI